MAELPLHGIPSIEEDEATGELAEIYDAIKRELQTPYVPNWVKALGTSPAALKMYLGFYRSFYGNMTLPQSLVAMICYAIAQKGNCTYCTALNELTCRTLGVDDDTLSAIATNLGEVNPERIRAIIAFALKTASSPKALAREDFDAVRAHGISDGEILEIILVAGAAVLNDVLADAIKVQVDEPISEALGH